MTDDWSLDEKEIKVLRIRHADGTSVEITFPDFCTVFPKEEIANLREKLIEAFEEKGKPVNLEEYQEFFTLNDIRVIINKKFGVK